MKQISKFFFIFFLSIILTGCKTLDINKNEKDRKGLSEEVLIDTTKIVTQGKKSLDKKS
jgi:hypothetical protein